MLAVIAKIEPELPWDMELSADSEGNGYRMVRYRTMLTDKIKEICPILVSSDELVAR
jgi:hypothetical protein